MAHLRTCVLCGNVYDYCPRCDETRPAFLLKHCSENCHDIYLVMNQYAFKHLTKEQAAMKLMKLNIELDKYNDHDREYLKDILDAVKKPEPKPEPVQEKVINKKPIKRTRIVNDI